MKKMKKGFTIVELVIVIAVIAILAGVLIPVFSNVVDKANKSKDTQLIRNLNTALTADEAINGKPNTMYDALMVVEEAGYNVKKINASASGKEILWDSENNVFCYLNEESNDVEYIPETNVSKPANHLLWKISGTVDTTYSTYYAGETAELLNVQDGLGLDIGTAKVGKVVYEGGNATNTFIVRTAGDCEFSMTNGTATVFHYANGGIANIYNAHSESYHLKGQVEVLEVRKGHVVIDKDSTVHTLVIANNDGLDLDVKSEDVKKIVVDIALGDENTSAKDVIENINIELPSAITEKLDEIATKVNTTSVDVMNQLKETAKQESCTHAWTETVVSVLDCVNDGVVESKCDYCGLTETSTTKATGHVVTNAGTCETCGETLTDADMINEGYVAKAGNVYYKSVAEANSKATSVFYILADSSEDVDISTIKGVIVNAGVNYTGTVTGKAVDFVGDSVAYFNSFDYALSNYNTYAKVSKSATIKLLSDLTVSKTIATANSYLGGAKLTIDLNGHTIASTNTSTSDNYLFQVKEGSSLAITSSIENAKIELGKSGLAKVYAGFEISNITVNQTEKNTNHIIHCYGTTNVGLGIDNVVINITAADNWSEEPFSVYGEVAIGNMTLNINYLGTALIDFQGSSKAVINGAKFNIEKFKRNANGLFSLSNAASLTIKDADINMGLDETYSSYFVNNNINEKDVTIENLTTNIIGLTSGATYIVDKETAKWTKVAA